MSLFDFSLVLYLVPFFVYAGPILLILFIEHNQNPVGLCFIGYLIFVQYFQVFDIIAFISYNIQWVIPAIIVYAICGVVISRIKFYIYMRREEQKEKFLKAIAKQETLVFVRKFVTENRLRITQWMLMWPLILAHMLLSEIYMFSANVLYDYFQSTYFKMAEKFIKSLQQQVANNASVNNNDNTSNQMIRRSARHSPLK